MKKNNMTDLFGVILIVIGALFVICPKGVFESIVMVAAVVIVLFSILSLLVALSNKKGYSMYLVISSVIGVVFGIILASNTDSAIKIIPVFLGLWLFISGLSTTLAMHKMNNSLTAMASPITRMFLGLICFIAPVVPITFVGVFIGAVLILAGINTIANSKNEEIVYSVKVKK